MFWGRRHASSQHCMIFYLSILSICIFIKSIDSLWFCVNLVALFDYLYSALGGKKNHFWWEKSEYFLCLYLLFLVMFCFLMSYVDWFLLCRFISPSLVIDSGIACLCFLCFLIWFVWPLILKVWIFTFYLVWSLDLLYGFFLLDLLFVAPFFVDQQEWFFGESFQLNSTISWLFFFTWLGLQVTERKPPLVSWWIYYGLEID